MHLKGFLRWFATVICAACGTAILVAAKSMDYQWFERHVLLPGYYPWTPAWVYRDVRAGVAIAGIASIAAAWLVGRTVARVRKVLSIRRKQPKPEPARNPHAGGGERVV